MCVCVCMCVCVHNASLCVFVTDGWPPYSPHLSPFSNQSRCPVSLSRAGSRSLLPPSPSRRGTDASHHAVTQRRAGAKRKAKRAKQSARVAWCTHVCAPMCMCDGLRGSGSNRAQQQQQQQQQRRASAQKPTNGNFGRRRGEGRRPRVRARSQPPQTLRYGPSTPFSERVHSISGARAPTAAAGAAAQQQGRGLLGCVGGGSASVCELEQNVLRVDELEALRSSRRRCVESCFFPQEELFCLVGF